MGSPLNPLDFVEPYLRTIYNFVGITDIHFINTQPMDITADLRKTAIQKAINEARDLVTENQWKDRTDSEVVEFTASATGELWSEECQCWYWGGASDNGPAVAVITDPWRFFLPFVMN